MGNERSLSSQPFFTSAGMNLHFYLKLLREEGMKEKIVIPFEILNMDAIAGKDLKSFKDGEIFGEGKRVLLRWNFLKTKEELE